MISAVVFNKAFRCHPEGAAYRFRPGVNLLVGDQGCGKSSLLGPMVRYLEPKEGAGDFFFSFNSEAGKAVHVLTEPVPIKRFVRMDFEHDNLRTKGYFAEGPGMMSLQLASMRWSHGETQQVFLKLLRECEDALFILDEPDMALSPRSIHALTADLQAAAARRCQVIASVHNAQLIAAFPEVLSLEHCRWMPSAEFLEAQKAPMVTGARPQIVDLGASPARKKPTGTSTNPRKDPSAVPAPAVAGGPAVDGEGLGRKNPRGSRSRVGPRTKKTRPVASPAVASPAVEAPAGPSPKVPKRHVGF